MIHVKHNGETIDTISEGGSYRLPNGDIVMPVVAGWSNGGISFEAAPAPEPTPEPTPGQILADWRETHAIPRPDFCINAHHMGLLSEADAESASSGNWPQGFEPIIAPWPLADRIRARSKWADNSLVYRSDPLLQALAVAVHPNLTPEQLDALCGWVDFSEWVG